MRGHVRPLQGHPQLEIIRSQLSADSRDAVVEYRVDNYKRQRDGTVVRGDGFSWFDLFWVIGLGMYWWIFNLSVQARVVLLEKSLSVCGSKLKNEMLTTQAPLFLWVILVVFFLFRVTRTVLHGKLCIDVNIKIEN